jgi:nucleoside-diphosphate-sugar epimerase
MSLIRTEAAFGSRIVLTHADSPIGRRLVKSLYHDPSVERIVALGPGPPPSVFDRFLSSDERRLTYSRIDLARHRSMATFFNSSLFKEARIDSMLYVPAHGWPTASVSPLAGGLASQTAEARLVLKYALELRNLEHLICLGSALVYRLSPGNSNLFTESSELDLAPDTAAEIRCWVNADMIFQGEFQNPGLRVVLLRLPSVVGTGGKVYFNPILAGILKSRIRSMGFDPICALVSDKDVVRAMQLALHSTARGAFNIAGFETVPLSVFARWIGEPSIPIPSALISLASRLSSFVGRTPAGTSAATPHLHYGFTLDTQRARLELGFEPGYRIAPGPLVDGRFQLETAPI